MPRTVLILSSTPRDMAPLRVHEEAREVEDAIRRARYRDEYQVVVRLGIRARDVHRVLLEHRPAIIHFSGHGHGEHGLVLEDDHGDSLLVSGANLARMFGHFRREIECVLFNACHSHAQIDEIARHIPFVIGMNQALPDRAAVTFAGAFYEALASGKSIPFAHELACSAVSVSGLSMDSVAVLAPATLAARDVAQASVDRRRTPSKDKQRYTAYASLIAIIVFGIFSLRHEATDRPRHENEGQDVTRSAQSTSAVHETSSEPPGMPQENPDAPQQSFAVRPTIFGAPPKNRQAAPRVSDHARQEPTAPKPAQTTHTFEISDVVIVEKRNHHRVIVKASSQSHAPEDLRSISISWTTGTHAACSHISDPWPNAATTLVDKINLHHYVISDTYVPFHDGPKVWVDAQAGLTAGHRHAAGFQIVGGCGSGGVSFGFDIVGKISRKHGITIMVDMPKEIRSASSATASMPIPDCRRFLPRTPARQEKQPLLTGESVTDAKAQALRRARELAGQERRERALEMLRPTLSQVTVKLTTNAGMRYFQKDMLPIAQLSCQKRLKLESRR